MDKPEERLTRNLNKFESWVAHIFITTGVQ